MGMYPGAAISYGLVLPEEFDYEGLPWLEVDEDGWFDFEYAADRRLREAGITGLEWAWSGHLGYGETTKILCSETRRYYAYDVCEITPESFHASVWDDDKLLTAWHLLFGEEPVAQPAWLLSLSYG